MTRITEPVLAFILHGRPYRETSALVDCFTRDYGRISTIAKGARAQRSKFRGLLQPTNPLLITWSGKRELVTLCSAEMHGPSIHLQGQHLVCALYLNELLMRLLAKDDPHPELFDCYAYTLRQFESGEKVQVLLRVFEKLLMQAIGYELLLTHEASSLAPILADENYLYDPALGPVRVEGRETRQGGLRTYRGETLLALADENFANEDILREAKWLMRSVLAYHLDERPLESRKLL